jgi:hypothetical protein
MSFPGVRIQLECKDGMLLDVDSLHLFYAAKLGDGAIEEQIINFTGTLRFTAIELAEADYPEDDNESETCECSCMNCSGCLG